MTSSMHTTPSGTSDPPVRLALVPPGADPYRLDGAWWPRSHDLARELPSLLAALEQRWPHITRITVSRPMWRTGPRQLILADRVLHINRSDVTHRPGAICLLSYGVGRCDLLVVPPGVTPSEGRRLLSAVPIRQSAHHGALRQPDTRPGEPAAAHTAGPANSRVGG